MRKSSPRNSACFPLFSRLRTALPCAITCAIAGMAAACSQETETVVTSQNPVQPSELDDTAPAELPPDSTLSFTDRWGRTVNHSTDRYRFDVAAFANDSEKAESEKLFASHADWLASRDWDAIPSVQTIGTYVKQLDDTIYAGVERAVQDGLQPTLEPKTTVLTGALEYLSSHRSTAGDRALVMVAASLKLGGLEPTFPSELGSQVDSLQQEYLSKPNESKPFGFYTWSAELQKIWQQDRLLQRELPGDSACAFAAAIAAEPSRKQRYVQLVNLYTRLTNPLHSSFVDILDNPTGDACTTDRAFVSSSRTPEVALFEQLYPDGVPPSADLMNDLVEGIRSGKVDLKPADGDGWYAHQLFALETLLVTDKAEERAKIAFMSRYKKRMREAFSTMLVQHRETHAKQADVALSGAAAPELDRITFRVEPLATVYVRHARSYVFLEKALDAVLGSEVLDKAVAVDANGKTQVSLRGRIQKARDLFFGVYLVASYDIGLRFKLDQPGDPPQSDWNRLAAEADKWLQALPDDPVAASDVRVMIPIAELGGERSKYWAVVGVRGTLAGYSLIHGTDVSPPKPEDQTRVWLPTEQFLEVESSSTPLSREEFRKLCDEKGTVEAIAAALQAR